MQRDKCHIMIFTWKTFSTNIGDSQWCVVWLKFKDGCNRQCNNCLIAFAKIWVREFVVISVGPAIVITLFYFIEFAVGKVVTEEISAIVCCVNVTIDRRPIESCAVAQAASENFFVRTVRVIPNHGPASFVLFVTHIT